MFALIQPTPAAQQLCFMVVIPWSSWDWWPRYPTLPSMFLMVLQHFCTSQWKTTRKKLCREFHLCVNIFNCPRWKKKFSPLLNMHLISGSCCLEISPPSHEWVWGLLDAQVELKTLTKRSSLARVYVYAEVKFLRCSAPKAMANVCYLLRRLNGFLGSTLTLVLTPGLVSDLVKVTAFRVLVHCFCGYFGGFWSLLHLEVEAVWDISLFQPIFQLPWLAQDEALITGITGGRAMFDYYEIQHNWLLTGHEYPSWLQPQLNALHKHRVPHTPMHVFFPPLPCASSGSWG